jgi:hypothetical protein
MSASVLVATSFDSKQLRGSEVKETAGGAAQVYLNYGPGRIRVQAPRVRVPFDAGSWNNNGKPKSSFSFEGRESNPRLQAFFNLLQAVDDFAVDLATKNPFAFKLACPAGSSRDMVKMFLSPAIKFSKDKKTGAIRTEYAPTFSGALKQKRTKDGRVLDEYDCDLFDGDKNKITDATPVDVLRRNAEVIPVLDATGIWIAGGKFGVTWKLVQARIMKFGDAGATGFVGVDDEEDGVASAAPARAAGGAGAGPAAFGGGAVSAAEEAGLMAAVLPSEAPADDGEEDEDDEDADDGEESEHEVPAPVVPVAAAKPVKKAAAAAAAPAPAAPPAVKTVKTVKKVGAPKA